MRRPGSEGRRVSSSIEATAGVERSEAGGCELGRRPEIEARLTGISGTDRRLRILPSNR